MPTRKLSDTPRQYCRDPEHEVPSHMVLDNGLYEHECPGCGNKIRFVVNKPTLHQQLDNIAKTTLSRKWSPVRTLECPVEDALHGGYCESDTQFRIRILYGENT